MNNNLQSYHRLRHNNPQLIQILTYPKELHLEYMLNLLQYNLQLQDLVDHPVILMILAAVIVMQAEAGTDLQEVNDPEKVEQGNIKEENIETTILSPAVDHPVRMMCYTF
eukprot:9646182-Ditylum_brightwellii.AAC.1